MPLDFSDIIKESVALNDSEIIVYCLVRLAEHFGLSIDLHQAPPKEICKLADLLAANRGSGKDIIRLIEDYSDINPHITITENLN